MAGLSRKDIGKLADSLEAQGAVLIPRKNGWTVRFPNGDTMGLHETASDTKSFDAMRAIVRRAGLDWVFDGKDKKAMNAEKRRKASENRELISMWLAENNVKEETDLIRPQQIMAELELDISSVYRALHALGWTKHSYGQWGHVRQLDPGLAELNEPKPVPTPGDVQRWNAQKQEPEWVPNTDTAQITKPPVEDWEPVKLTNGIADIPVAQLMRAYKAAGFQMEIRIRKELSND